MERDNRFCIGCFKIIGSMQSKEGMCLGCYHLKEEIIARCMNSLATEDAANYLADSLQKLVAISNDHHHQYVDVDKMDTSMKSATRRCDSCNKKVGLLGFKCKCGGEFCGLHRLPETHLCVVSVSRMFEKLRF